MAVQTSHVCEVTSPHSRVLSDTKTDFSDLKDLLSDIKREAVRPATPASPIDPLKDTRSTTEAQVTQKVREDDRKATLHARINALEDDNRILRINSQALDMSKEENRRLRGEVARLVRYEKACAAMTTEVECSKRAESLASAQIEKYKAQADALSIEFEKTQRTLLSRLDAAQQLNLKLSITNDKIMSEHKTSMTQVERDLSQVRSALESSTRQLAAKDEQIRTADLDIRACREDFEKQTAAMRRESSDAHNMQIAKLSTEIARIGEINTALLGKKTELQKGLDSQGARLFETRTRLKATLSSLDKQFEVNRELALEHGESVKRLKAVNRKQLSVADDTDILLLRGDDQLQHFEQRMHGIAEGMLARELCSALGRHLVLDLSAIRATFDQTFTNLSIKLDALQINGEFTDDLAQAVRYFFVEFLRSQYCHFEKMRSIEN